MAAEALKLDNVKKSFSGTEIIRGLNLSVGQNERHAIIGPNGAGKSTAYNLITGRYEVSSGQIFLNGQEITNLQPYEVKRKGLSRSFQITNIFPKMSVFENVRCSLLWAMDYKYSFWHMVGKQLELNENAEKIIEELNLKDRRDTLAGVLSYAEQRALEIGITIAGGSEVILLDEPTAGMSVSETEYIVGLILRKRALSFAAAMTIAAGRMGLLAEKQAGCCKKFAKTSFLRVRCVLGRVLAVPQNCGVVCFWNFLFFTRNKIIKKLKKGPILVVCKMTSIWHRARRNKVFRTFAKKIAKTLFLRVWCVLRRVLAVPQNCGVLCFWNFLCFTRNKIIKKFCFGNDNGYNFTRYNFCVISHLHFLR